MRADRLYMQIIMFSIFCAFFSLCSCYFPQNQHVFSSGPIHTSQKMRHAHYRSAVASSDFMVWYAMKYAQGRDLDFVQPHRYIELLHVVVSREQSCLVILSLWGP